MLVMDSWVTLCQKIPVDTSLVTFSQKYSRKYKWRPIDAFLSTIKQKRHYEMAYHILQKHIT